MEPTTQNNPLSTLGQRLRLYRLERGLTQEGLAGSEFTKGYISSLERGTVRPSLKALDLLAQRLHVPVSEFLSTAPNAEEPTDLAALAEDLNYQLNYANMLIHSDQVQEAIQLIRSAEEQAYPHRKELPAEVRYRIPYLQGLAYLRDGDTVMARTRLGVALALFPDEQEQENSVRVRNLLGVSFYQEGKADDALAQHQRCLRAIEAGQVRDPNLRLSIYANIANDYWARDEVDKAIVTYEEALKLFDDFKDPDRQARLYWGLSSAYRAEGNWSKAKHYATQALHIYQVVQNSQAVAAIMINLAEILIKQEDFGRAAEVLASAKEALTPNYDPILASIMYQNCAELASRQGDLARAAEYARESIRLTEPPPQDGGAAPTRPIANSVRARAKALHATARIEEQVGNQQLADELFQQALTAIADTNFTETAYEISYDYAEALKQRGAFELAMEYYRRAARYHRHATD